MGGWKAYLTFCQSEGRDPSKAKSHRAYDLMCQGLPYPDPEAAAHIDGEPTWEQIEQLTSGVSGTVNVPCWYCGPHKPYSTRMQITRTILHADYRCYYCGACGRVENPDPVPDELIEQDAKVVREQKEEKRRRQFERAMNAWRESMALTPNTLGYQYLKARGLFLPPNPDEVLRWHEHCTWEPPGQTAPCIVALFRDAITNQPTGIHRIHPISPVVAEKMSLGSTKGTPMVGVIKLWPRGNSETLAVGEGIENVLSAVQLGIAQPPAWATTVAYNLGRVPVINGVKHLLILADNEQSGTGIEKATKLYRTWSRFGLDAEITHPREVGTDFNDLLVRRRMQS